MSLEPDDDPIMTKSDLVETDDAYESGFHDGWNNLHNRIIGILKAQGSTPCRFILKEITQLHPSQPSRLEDPNTFEPMEPK